jgi:hypothetical protein
MIKEAVEKLGGKATYSEIKDYIRHKYGEVNEGTINCQIIACTVNQPSRIHYPENNKARVANSKYDFLFSTKRGKVELYNPSKHGTWEIRKDEYGKLTVVQTGIEEFPASEDIELIEDKQELSFPVESHLRDFIAQNIDVIKINDHKLKLYIDNNGREGIEYPTDVGIIDILAVDEIDNFVVFELKLSRGTDRAVGQILRYIGWVKKNLANDRSVTGIIVANIVDEKLKYATFTIPDIKLFEYELNFKIHEVSIDEGRDNNV